MGGGQLGETLLIVTIETYKFLIDIFNNVHFHNFHPQTTFYQHSKGVFTPESRVQMNKYHEAAEYCSHQDQDCLLIGSTQSAKTPAPERVSNHMPLQHMVKAVALDLTLDIARICPFQTVLAICS